MEFMKKITEITKKVGEAASDTYKTVADKSGKFFKDTKTKMEISDREDELKKVYEDIGNTVYNMYLSGEDVGTVFTKECKKIDKMKKEIEDLNKAILLNKELRTCQNCGETIPLDSVFCSNCGMKQKPIKVKEENTNRQEKETKEEAKVEKVCPQCGNINETESKFCIKCGYKL